VRVSLNLLFVDSQTYQSDWFRHRGGPQARRNKISRGRSMWSPSADSFSDPGSIPGTSTINTYNINNLQRKTRSDSDRVDLGDSSEGLILEAFNSRSDIPRRIVLRPSGRNGHGLLLRQTSELEEVSTALETSVCFLQKS